MIESKIIKKGNLIPEKEWSRHIDSLKSEHKKQKLDFKKEFINAVNKRLHGKRFGILFSGGIDSTLIAFVCKKLNADFICYTVGLENSPDIIAAEQTAKKYGFELKKRIISLEEIEKTIKEVAGIVGPDTMKVGVGAVVYEAVKLAKKDKINDLFSGLGSEEIFAGYERHSLSKDVNLECWSGLKSMYQRDFLRDFSIAKVLDVNVLVPFLDPNVIMSAMQIPGEEKIKEGYKKYALRKSAEETGLKDAWRKKKAAQYGSCFDKAIQKLAKKNNFKYKKNYINSLFPIGALVSSGKDSVYAMYRMIKQDFPVKCMITLRSLNPDSYMFHTPAIDMVKLQSESTGIPLIEQETAGEKEDELMDLRKALEKAKERFGIKGVVTGALYSDYQRERIEKTCSETGLLPFSPLWHMDQENYMRELIRNNFKIILTRIAAEGLDESWLGRILTEEDVDRLIELNKKIKLSVCGEGGEFETLVLDCPLFNKELKVIRTKKVMDSKFSGTLIITEIKMVEK
jgi:asparagine synthase (glutamine-hydrolysing)